MNFITSFLTGLLMPLRAVGLIIKTPKLLLWCLAPFAISVGAYYLLWGEVLGPVRDYISQGFGVWLAGILGQGQLSELGAAAQWIVKAVVSVIFFIAMLLTFAWVANIAALPVNDFVAQATERSLIPPLERAAYRGFLHELGLIWIDFKKSILSLIGILICLSFSWIPIMNIFAMVITWLLLTYQYVSFPQTRRGIGASQAVIEIFRNFWLTSGFGLAVAFCLTIPFLCVFVPPVAVVGGTMLFAKMKHQYSSSQES